MLPGRSILPDMEWPGNVERIMHLDPRYHAEFYCSSRMTLNVTRREMVIAGYSPSVRLFEAAACGAAIVSDNWPGLETFFTPGEEILLAASAEDVVRYLNGFDASELRRIGHAARERVLAVAHQRGSRTASLSSAVEMPPLQSSGADRVKSESPVCQPLKWFSHVLVCAEPYRQSWIPHLTKVH